MEGVCSVVCATWAAEAFELWSGKIMVEVLYLGLYAEAAEKPIIRAKCGKCSSVVGWSMNHALVGWSGGRPPRNFFFF